MIAKPPLVEARALSKRFGRTGGLLGSARPGPLAVAEVDLTIESGTTVALVGESGSGKSTLGRLILRLIEPDRGTIRFDGVDLLALRPRELRRMRRHFQLIFQDAGAALNPHMRVASAIAEPILVHGLAANRAERRERVARLIEQVGLDPGSGERYPHQFSGGQRQRIGIARAIACSPRLVVADEPVSALDPPIQAQIINLLLDLQAEIGLSYLFIAHDLRLVERIADRVAVMYLGRIVEEAQTAELFSRPLHPYTQALLDSTPRLRPGVAPPPALVCDLPSATEHPPGCPFHPRCPIAVAACSTERPALVDQGGGRSVACLRVTPPGPRIDR